MVRPVLAFALALLYAGPAAAAPVARSADLRLTAFVPGSGGLSFDFSASAIVSVDATAEEVSFAAGIFSGLSMVVPVSHTTSLHAISVTNLGLGGGALRPGGGATQAPGDVCPPGGPPVGAGDACVFGDSLGGALALNGTLNIAVIFANTIVIPVPLAPVAGVGGVTIPTGFSLSIHGAPWTLGRAIAATPLGMIEPNEPHRTQGIGASVAGTLDVGDERFSLVTPIFAGQVTPPVVQGSLLPAATRPWRLEIAFTDGLGIPQFIVDAFDRDGDGVTNWSDNCPDDPNAGQEDADSDGKGNACELECQDGLDNDGDGDVDLADSACLVGSFDDESPPCADGQDNDSDGLVDFPADPGCANVAWPAEDPACDDGADNDTDGDIDYPADEGCAAAWATSEAPECSDGVDNDLDGAIDAPADAGCENAAGATEAPACNDGKNNDAGQDTLIDFDGGAAAGLPAGQQTAPDPECNGVGWGVTEIKALGCGLGGEAGLAVLAVAALRRRRRAPLRTLAGR